MSPPTALLAFVFVVVFMYRKNTFKANFQRAVHLQSARSLSATVYLIAIWCLLDVLWWSQCVFKVRRYCQSPWTFPGLWLAGVVTENEKRWESHSKENLLPRMARRAFTMCQCSQPSCSLRVCGIVPLRHNEGTAFKFNFGGCHK